MNEELNLLSEQIIGAAIEVHREIGPGVLEHSYEASLQHELALRGISSVRQLLLPLVYKGLIIPDSYRIDLLVEDRIVVEIKTVEALKPVHSAQVLTYLRMSGKPLGLLINFHVPLLRDGLKRLVHQLPN
jgi:GxxExxY protein